MVGWVPPKPHTLLLCAAVPFQVQLHIRPLFELKGNLHVLYAGARVLGALEDTVAKHEGPVERHVPLCHRLLGDPRTTSHFSTLGCLVPDCCPPARPQGAQ